MVQVIKINGNLPDDRESLFYLKGHFLPAATSGDSDKVSMTFSYVLLQKMFYRPAKLKSSFDAIDNVVDQLDFEVSGNKLNITNRSPYYITLNYICTNKEIVDIPENNSMLEPFGKLCLELKNKNVNEITWSLLNDGGYATKLLTRKL